MDANFEAASASRYAVHARSFYSELRELVRSPFAAEEAAAAGLHVPNRLKHLSSADWTHLAALIESHDPVLMAVAAESRWSSTSGESVLMCHDTIDSFIRCGRSWRRSYRYPKALALLHDLHIADPTDADALQLLAYRYDNQLLTALDQAIARSRSSRNASRIDAALDITIRHILSREAANRMDAALKLARQTLNHIMSEPDRISLFRISTAGLQHLSALIDQSDARIVQYFMSIAGDNTISGVNKSAVHSLIRLGGEWVSTLEPTDQALIQFIREMQSDQLIDSVMADGLESLAFSAHPPLLAAYAIYTAAIRDAEEESEWHRQQPPRPLDGEETVTERAISLRDQMIESALERANDQAWAEWWDTIATIIHRTNGIVVPTQSAYLIQLLRSMHHERVLSAVESNYLLSLASGAGRTRSRSAGDDSSASLALQAAYQLFMGDDDGIAMGLGPNSTSTAADLAEFTHTLKAIVTRWRKRHAQAPLLSYIRSLHDNSQITFEERDCLERLVIDKADPTLLTAAAVAFDSTGNWSEAELASRQSNTTTDAAEPVSTAAAAVTASGGGALFAVMCSVLRRELYAVARHLSAVGKQHVRSLRRSELIPFADALYLIDLINGFADDDSDWYMDRPPKTLENAEATEAVIRAPNRTSQVLFAALAERYFTGGELLPQSVGGAESEFADAELNDTLIRLGARWRSADINPDSTRRGLLDLLGFFQDVSERPASDAQRSAYPHFLRSELETLEALVYREDARLYSVYQNCFVASDVGNAAKSFDRLAAAMRAVIDTQYDDECQRYALAAAHYVRELQKLKRTTPTQHEHLSRLVGMTDPVLLAAFGTCLLPSPLSWKPPHF